MIISENSKKIAKWWTEQLKNSRVKLDDGTGEMNFYRAKAIEIEKFECAMHSEDELRRFEEALAELVEIRSASQNSFIVRVDYDPDDTLCKAAESAGINLDWASLPIKTFTRISSGEVWLKHGYSAPHVKL